MAYDVFLVSALADRDMAKLVARRLRALKFKVWLDQKQTDDTFDAKDARDAMNSQSMLVLWSKEAVKSDWVRAAASIGHSRQGMLLQTGLDKTVPYEPFKTDKRYPIGEMTSRKTPEGFYQVVEELGRRDGRTDLRKWMDIPKKDLDARAAWLSAHPVDALSLHEKKQRERKLGVKPAPAAAAAAAATLAAASLKGPSKGVPTSPMGTTSGGAGSTGGADAASVSTESGTGTGTSAGGSSADASSGAGGADASGSSSGADGSGTGAIAAGAGGASAAASLTGGGGTGSGAGTGGSGSATGSGTGSTSRSSVTGSDGSGSGSGTGGSSSGGDAGGGSGVGSFGAPGSSRGTSTGSMSTGVAASGSSLAANTATGATMAATAGAAGTAIMDEDEGISLGTILASLLGIGAMLFLGWLFRSPTLPTTGGSTPLAATPAGAHSVLDVCPAGQLPASVLKDRAARKAPAE